MLKQSEIQNLLIDYLKRFPAEESRIKIVTDYADRTPTAQLYSRKNFDGHITTSSFIMNPSGHILLLKHKVLDRWLQPGGHVENDSSLLVSALREAEEETGIPAKDLHYIPVDKNEAVPFDIDPHYIPANPKKMEDGHYHHDIRYLFVYSGSGDISFNIDESTGMRWLTFGELLMKDESFTKVIAKIPDVLRAAFTEYVSNRSAIGHNIFDVLDDAHNLFGYEDGFSDWFQQQLSAFPDEVTLQVRQKISLLEKQFDEKTFLQLYTIFQSMVGDEPLYRMMSPALVSIFFDHVDLLIDSNHYVLNLLLDLFNEAFRDTMLHTDEMRRQLVTCTYPLLTRNRQVDRGSDTDLAIFKFIQLLNDRRFPGGKELLHQFIADHPESQYIEDIKFALK